MNEKTKKCEECKYELENNLPVSYNQFAEDFEIESVSGDSLGCGGVAKCKRCNFSVNFMQECLLNEKLYLAPKSN